MPLRTASHGCRFWAALACIPFSAALASEPILFNLGPNQPLAIALNLAPNQADMLWFGDNTPLSTTGLPSITGQLFNNGNLLGTFTQQQTGYFEMAFESLASQYTLPPGTAFGILPTRVDLSNFNMGTTTGCLFVTVTGGSISLNPATLFAYDTLSSDNPLGGMSAETYWTVPPPATSITGVANAASYSARAAAESSPLPTRLSGLSMQFGNDLQAPLFYTSTYQVNLQIPWELASQTQTTLAATLNGQTIPGQTFNLTAFSPGIFATNSAGTGQGAIWETAYRLVDTANPATPGTTAISIYCTGLGQVTNQPATGSPGMGNPLSATVTKPTATIGGVPATVLFSGLAPGYVGLYQVNAQVPAAAPAGSSVPVVVSMGGIDSNPVMIAVQ